MREISGISDCGNKCVIPIFVTTSAKCPLNWSCCKLHFNTGLTHRMWRVQIIDDYVTFIHYTGEETNTWRNKFFCLQGHRKWLEINTRLLHPQNKMLEKLFCLYAKWRHLSGLVWPDLPTDLGPMALVLSHLLWCCLPGQQPHLQNEVTTLLCFLFVFKEELVGTEMPE